MVGSMEIEVSTEGASVGSTEIFTEGVSEGGVVGSMDGVFVVDDGFEFGWVAGAKLGAVVGTMVVNTLGVDDGGEVGWVAGGKLGWQYPQVFLQSSCMNLFVLALNDLQQQLGTFSILQFWF